MAIVPTIYFALLSIRLPQYAILSSTSFVVLGSVALSYVKPKLRAHFFVLLLVLHVLWVLSIFSTSFDRFTGWGFYITPMTTLIADFFYLLWTFGARTCSV